MNCRIINIGDELLIGDTLNANAVWLGKFLTSKGVKVVEVRTIRDNAADIKEAITNSFQSTDLTITTGGLGPTHDDLTKQLVAEIFDASLIVHQPTLQSIKKRLGERNIPISKSNFAQAEVPENCEVLFNKKGTAPGLWFDEGDSCLAVLPGIPREMKALISGEVWPKIQQKNQSTESIFSRYLKVAGIGESTLSDEVIGSLDDYLSPGVSVAFLPSPVENTIRITTKSATQAEADAMSNKVAQYIYKKAGKYIIGEGKDLTLSQAVGKALRNHSKTIAVAESCTGGLLASRLTDVPGSSDYFKGGVVAYANEVKINRLGVSKDDLNQFGAVSKKVALQMARSIAQIMKTDIGLSTTGIAGPGGGTKDKPVGTVWIGFWKKNAHFALKAFFSDSRTLNKERSVAVALETTRRRTLHIEPMPYALNPHFV